MCGLVSNEALQNGGGRLSITTDSIYISSVLYVFRCFLGCVKEGDIHRTKTLCEIGIARQLH